MLFACHLHVDSTCTMINWWSDTALLAQSMTIDQCMTLRRILDNWLLPSPEKLLSVMHFMWNPTVHELYFGQGSQIHELNLKIQRRGVYYGFMSCIFWFNECCWEPCPKYNEWAVGFLICTTTFIQPYFAESGIRNLYYANPLYGECIMEMYYENPLCGECIMEMYYENPLCGEWY